MAEYRESGRQAYLCPREVYDALVAEMTEVAELVQFPALLQGVAARIGKEVSDYGLPARAGGRVAHVGLRV